MKWPEVTYADWRAAVETELAGAAFDKALVHATAEGLSIQPLYTETSVDPGLPGAAPFTRGASAEAQPFRICMRVPVERRPESLREELEAGADALWSHSGDLEAFTVATARGVPIIVDERGPGDVNVSEASIPTRADDVRDPVGPLSVWSGNDVIAAVAAGRSAPRILRELPDYTRVCMGPGLGETPLFGPHFILVSGVPYHDAGADAADELALMLSSVVAYLRPLLANGFPLLRIANAMWARVAIGQDTFGEICKLRALRTCWHKLFAAAGAPGVALDAIHAVCSSRTLGQYDPWVNMLRGTTQVFAAALGGAQLITPRSFDEALGPASAFGRRVARNTALILREESQLGRVLDAAGGSYYIETRTDQLARAGWSRFRELERDGGIVALLESGALRERLAASWGKRAAAIARRKVPVLGVSEFANVGERLPAPVPGPAPAPAAPALVPHRDAEAFEALRTRVEAAPRDVVLVTLGPPSEHRARVGYAAAFFATAGLRPREIAAPAESDVPRGTSEATGGDVLDGTGEAPSVPRGSNEAPSVPREIDIACLCGSDERYASEAVAHATALRAAGARKIVLAGRPGTLEAELRAAGVDAFLFVGCDVLATLTDLVAGRGDA